MIYITENIQTSRDFFQRSQTREVNSVPGNDFWSIIKLLYEFSSFKNSNSFQEKTAVLQNILIKTDGRTKANWYKTKALSFSACIIY